LPAAQRPRGGGSAFAPVTKRLGCVAYETVFAAMREANRARDACTHDEFWLLQHAPVFTLGLAGKPEHVLAAGDIPVIRTDRGGQVTYHGPGQAVVYLMLDVRRLGFGVKELVRRIEEGVIRMLADYRIAGYRLPGMPGVYVMQRARHAKIAAIGLRVANHATYHGVALNVDMDLEPFARINPCGHRGLAVTQLKDLGVGDNADQAGEKLLAALVAEIYGNQHA
jgi:lipoyl(octanoyl) transferase